MLNFLEVQELFDVILAFSFEIPCVQGTCPMERGQLYKSEQFPHSAPHKLVLNKEDSEISLVSDDQNSRSVFIYVPKNLHTFD